jgi:hypothetical protein
MLNDNGTLDTGMLSKATGQIGHKEAFNGIEGLGQIVDFQSGLKRRQLLGSLGSLKGAAETGGMQDLGNYQFAQQFDERFSKELDLMDKIEVVLKADADRRMQDWDAMMGKLGITLDDALDPVGIGLKLWKGMTDAAKGAQKTPTTPRPKKTDVNVTIHKMEVVADDADRVVIGMMSLTEDALRNPSTAAGVYRDR